MKKAPSKNTFNLSAWALENPQMVSFFMLLMMVIGSLSYTLLPRNEDPAFTIKTAVVSAQWPGASVTDTTHLVTDVLEKKLQETPWLDYIESETRAGQTVIYINLRDDTPAQKVPAIWYQIRKKMQDIAPSLPEGAQGPSVNDEFDDTYGTIYAFIPDGYTLREVRQQVETIRRELMSVPDIGKTVLLGEQQEQIAIAFSPARLAGMGLSIQQVTDALRAQNAVVPAGVLRTGQEKMTINVSGALRSEESLRAVTLRINDRYLPLTDIATIERRAAEPPSAAYRVNGRPAIGLAISMAPTGNMLRFGATLNDRMSAIGAGLPHGIEMVKVADQSAVVSEAVSGFIRVLIEAVVIVLAVSFVSLGLRAGLVVATAIPLVLAMTFAGMMLAGIGLQRISLGALIIALGLLVDDAMIAVETMVSRLEAGDSRRLAATHAFKTTAFPMLTGTLVMIAGFIPVGFAASSAGEYCFSLFAVVLIALLCSWAVAILFSPLTGTWLLPEKVRSHAAGPGRIARLQHVHPAEQHERQVVRYVDITNANHFLFHKFALSGCNRNGFRLMQCNLFMRNGVDLRADHLADRILRALLNEIAQIQQRHVIAVQLGVYQPAVADLIRIFRIKLQQRFAGAQGQLHLPLFHQRRLQGVQQLADHLGVIRFVEIFIKQFRHRPDVALQPYLQGMLVEGLAVKRINQPHLFAGFRVRTQQHLGREDHRHHRQRQALGDPQQDRA